MKKLSILLLLLFCGFTNINAVTMTGGGGSGDATSIRGIDVTDAAPNNGDILIYSTTGPQINWAALAGGGDMLKATYDADTNGIVDDTEAVNLITHTYTTVADNEIIQYDSGSSAFINQTFTEADIASKSTVDTHISSNGSDHSYIDQDVTSGSSPTFTSTNFSGASGITGLGTIATGVWQGTAVADTYVANDLTLAGGTIGTSAITLVQSGGPTPTSEGVIEWDTDDDLLIIGDSSNSRKFSDEDFLIVACSDETTDLAAASANITFRFPPYACTIIEVGANCNTAPVGSVITVNIRESGTSILSTLITIDASEKTSESAAVPPVVSDTTIASDAEITVDIDGVGSSTAGKGLKVWFRYRRT